MNAPVDYSFLPVWIYLASYRAQSDGPCLDCSTWLTAWGWSSDDTYIIKGIGIFHNKGTQRYSVCDRGWNFHHPHCWKQICELLQKHPRVYKAPFTGPVKLCPSLTRTRTLRMKACVQEHKKKTQQYLPKLRCPLSLPKDVSTLGDTHNPSRHKPE